MKKKKNSKSTTETFVPSKKLSWLEKYEILTSWRKKPVSDATLDLLAKELLEWAQISSSLKVTEFLSPRLISWRVYCDWCNRYEPLKEANTFVNQMLGDRRERLALFKENNCEPKTIHFTLGHYCKVWEKAEDKISERRTNEKGNEGSDIHVHLEKYPNSDIVPERNKDD